MEQGRRLWVRNKEKTKESLSNSPIELGNLQDVGLGGRIEVKDEALISGSVRGWYMQANEE